MSFVGLGAAFFLGPPLIAWMTDAVTYLGDEGDAPVLFAVYLGVGLLPVLTYAGLRDTRYQLDGMNVIMAAVGLAGTIQYLASATALGPWTGLGAAADETGTRVGPIVGVLSLLLYYVATRMLAREDRRSEEAAVGS